ncbi:MAG TPA: hypothetical protein VJ742_06980 [Nitrososphaera sp.]|nr:hypothetical protein [Nitrososphaera sp.]
MLISGSLQECISAARTLGIDKIGAHYDGKKIEDVIYRMCSPPSAPPAFPYLVTSDVLDSVQDADLVTISNFRKAKNMLKKKHKDRLGLEFVVAAARKMSGEGVARWLGDLKDAYSFCESSGGQFILSSGARSPSEMISGRSFDAILNEIGVHHDRHWQDLDKWLSDVLSRKVLVK